MNRLVLVYNHPELGERWHELEPGKVYSLGSMEDNDIVFPQRDVSRHHAKLVVGPSTLRIVDLDSKNGTWVDGRRVTTAAFRCGDPVMLSSAMFVVVEMSSGMFEAVPEEVSAAENGGSPGRERTEETVHHTSGLGIVEFVELMEHVAEGCRGGSAAPVLDWAVRRLGARGAMMIVRGEGGALGVVASAGDAGRLLEGGKLERLLDVVAASGGLPGAGSVEVAVGESARLVTVGARHVLVLELDGVTPADLEIRALGAALRVVVERMERAGGETGAAAEPAPERPLAEAVAEFERSYILRVLDEVGGHRQRAAERLGLTRAGLFKKMRRLGMSAPGSGETG